MLMLFIILSIIITPNYTLTMDSNDSPRMKIVPFKRKLNIFDPKKIIAKGATLTAWFNSNLTLTPDEKKILISTQGQLYQTLVKDPFNTQAVELIIKHPSSTLSTMVTVSQKKDKSNEIVSGANFFNQERQKWTSEIIIYNDKAMSYIVKYQDWPLQTIKFNPQGTFLVGANLSSIILFDLKGNATDCSGFNTPSSGHLNSYALNKIVDLAINKNLQLIVAGKNGSTKLIHAENGLHNTKQNLWKDAIKAIHFPTDDRIIYSTPNGQTKIIDFFDLLESQQRSKADDFSHLPTHTQVSLNTSNNIAVAHWTNNEHLSEDERTTIYVYRINNDVREVFELHASFDDPTYDFISNTGQLEERIAHFLTVTFFENTLVALTTNGDIFIWHLPPIEANISNQENKEHHKGKNKEDNSTKRGLVRQRSKSSEENPYAHTPRAYSSPIETNHSRKSSPRNPLNFMKLTTPRHASSSPRHSGNNSPVNSPRGHHHTETKQ